MATSYLTREEMHDRVDAVFDGFEEVHGDEAVALIGQIVGDLQVHAPTDTKDYFRVDPTVAFAPMSFDGGCYTLGEAVRIKGQRQLLGTVIIGKDDLAEDVQAALDGDEDAIETLTGGEA